MELLIFISLIFCVWEMLLISIVEIMRLVICLKSAIFFLFFFYLYFLLREHRTVVGSGGMVVWVVEGPVEEPVEVVMVGRPEWVDGGGGGGGKVVEW